MYNCHLEQYKGRATRYTCPACGTARTFVRYVDILGQHFGAEVGRCNRESKCGYHYPPRQYFADHPERSDHTGRQTVKRQTALSGHTADRAGPLAVWTLPAHHFTASLAETDYERNAFVQFLLTLFEAARVRALVERFGIGTAADGRTVFWQLDRTGQVRTGQALHYGPDGKRDKTSKPDWMHSRLDRAGQLPVGFVLRQCLFGEHQLRLASEADKPCAIVEAPKTAIIAAGWMPEFLWLATGGKNNLNEGRLRGLGQRQVVLFPDADGFAVWQAKAAELRRVCPTLVVADVLERNLTADQKAEGLDIADFLIREARQRAPDNRPPVSAPLPAEAPQTVPAPSALAAPTGPPCPLCGAEAERHIMWFYERLEIDLDTGHERAESLREVVRESVCSVCTAVLSTTGYNELSLVEAVEERAAIYEYDGGLSRAEAERRAAQEAGRMRDEHTGRGRKMGQHGSGTK